MNALLHFFFDEPQLLQALKFELISFWGKKGGGLQYFAPIPATGEHKHDFIKIKSRLDKKKSCRPSVVNVPLRLYDLLPVLRPQVLPRGQGSEAPRPALQEALQLQLGPQ